jgi:hypothetical protein
MRNLRIRGWDHRLLLLRRFPLFPLLILRGFGEEVITAGMAVGMSGFLELMYVLPMQGIAGIRAIGGRRDMVGCGSRDDGGENAARVR